MERLAILDYIIGAVAIIMVIYTAVSNIYFYQAVLYMLGNKFWKKS